MNRIKAFSGRGNNIAPPTATSRKSGDASRSDSPQIQAAALAAVRSASRTPQTISPIKKATTGISPSRREAISPAPKPDFLSAQSSRPLHAPAPIRKIPAVAHSLANVANEERSSNERPLSRQLDSLKNPVSTETVYNWPRADDVFNSTSSRKPSTSPPRQSSGSQLNKEEPKLAKSISKPMPASSINEEKMPRPLKPKKSVPRLPEDTFTNAPQSPRNTPRIRDTSRPNTATTQYSFTQSTPDEASITNSSHNTISHQNTGNTDSTSGMTKESLANAIIASSLASSRAPSPYNPPPPLPPPRRSRSHSLLHPGDILKKDIRASPPKGLRQTLRDPPKSDEEANKNANRRHLIKHPNKHHEGDRRRWRQEVAATARKRYEGLWAANKGLWVPSEKILHQIFPELPRALVASDLVVHLVVRDIWSRSRLPDHTLEQIWDLVDRKGIGMLGREEFVVGLWLIDETLRGHKIPVKVPDSVWESVRHTPGIKVPQEF